MSNRVNAKLYKVQDLIAETVPDTEEFIMQMIEDYFTKSGNQFLSITLRDDLVGDDYKSRLFVLSTEQKPPNWRNFLNEIVEDENNLDGLDAQSASFILFVFNDNRIYAITKGYFGRFLLDENMDRFFGLDVLSRLVDKNVTEIRKLEERGVFGSVLGAERYFREDYNLVYEDDFGKIYKTLLASINEEYFARLGIVKKRDDTTRVSASGSSSFEVSTNFDYEELIQRIKKIEELLRTEGVQFNQFYRLSSTELAAVKDNLDLELIKLAYNSYLSSESVDFYHPDIFSYMKATNIRFHVLGDPLEIPIGQSIGFIDIINKLINNNIVDSTSEDSFIQSMKDCYGGYSINEDDAYFNDVTIDNWIGGEIEFDGKNFFKLDNHWYKYREGFNEYLNNHLNDINFDQLKPPVSLNDWDFNEFPTEGGYNKQYKEIEGFIVTDTAFLYYLEVCDLIKITEDTIYLYHVKKGLGRDLRVLTNQIINASRLLTNAIGEDNNESLETYYDAISNKQYENQELGYISPTGDLVNLKKGNFVHLLNNKKISFVFAYSSNSLLNLKDEIISTNSRIAKLSLLYCMRDLRRTDFEFLIERINHT